MKIIAIDNHAREEIADRLVISTCDEKTGKLLLKVLLAGVGEHDPWWYKLVEDDYRLSKGMEDLV